MQPVPAILSGLSSSNRRIPFVRPALPACDALEPAIREMLANGQLTKGTHLENFERAVAAYLGVRHAVAVSSCTTGLMLAYRGLGLEGDVIVPSFTFMATVSALVWAGLRPVFADVNRTTATLDADAVERAITSRTTAIVAVHTFGNPAEIDRLKAVADRHGLKLIFDAAHGFGTHFQGRPVGSQGDAQVFSLSPTKLLVACEGGIVATNDDHLAHQVRLGREYGNDGSYDSAFAGMNARMPEFNALLGCHSLQMLEQVARRRNALAALYRKHLSSIPGSELFEVLPGDRCSYKDFSIVIDPEVFGLNRDQVALALAAENIDTRKYYWPAVHQQTAYRCFASHDDLLPNTELLAQRSLSLPMYTQLDNSDVAYIAQLVQGIHEWSQEIQATLDGARPSAITSAMQLAAANER